MSDSKSLSNAEHAVVCESRLIYTCVDTPLLTVALLLDELKEVDNWFMLGTHLNVLPCELNKIKVTYAHEGVERCKMEMLQYWLDNAKTPSWKDIVGALEQLNMLQLVLRLTRKYVMRKSPATPGVFSCVHVCLCALCE